MKKLVVVCSFLAVASLTAFAQTNAPPGHAAAAHPPLAQRKAKESPSAPVPVSSAPTLARDAQLTSDQMNLYRRISDGRLLAPAPSHNYNETFTEVFHPWSGLAGRTEVRDTIVTIFPAGP